MLTQNEMDKVLLEAKKKLAKEQIINAIKRCSYGGTPVDMSLKGGDLIGKAYRSPTGKD